MTKKQKIFADEYLIDLNATRAYKVAYPSVKKDETAAQAGSRMLRNVKVAAYIQERMEERQKRTEITQDRVLEELTWQQVAGKIGRKATEESIKKEFQRFFKDN